jgi:hypothetical protein
LALVAALLAGCQLSQSDRAQITISITADGKTQRLGVPAGSSVAQTLAEARIKPGNLDKSEPPFYALLRDGDSVKLTRVEERIRTEVTTVPFERRVLRNESLPEGQERLVQSGVNGQRELTYRAVLEDGIQISESIVKSVVLQEPVPEILMVGASASFAPLPIPGGLAFLAAGNAWIVNISTANRRLLVNSGDLDGRVFALSPDGSNLLFTRKSTKAADQQINTLWVVNTKSTNPEAISLNAANIVHFAAWYPNAPNSVAYSTVEPRGNAPGWQANNDLFRVTVGGLPRKLLEPGAGGIYGWWGTSFAFAPDGRLAYARPDEIGLVSQDGGYLAPLVSIAPLQTHGDWAWTPAITWGADSETLYFVDHAPALPPVSPEESPLFDLKAASIANDAIIDIAAQVGMFAFPAASPARLQGAEQAFQVAFLQAIFPDQSETSRYRLVVMDRDASNRRVLFPPADLPGMEPQTPVWAPEDIAGQTGEFLCIVYRGDLWLIDTGNGQARQVTGDGLVSRVDWK